MAKPKKDRLTPQLKNYGPNDLEDHLVILAANIESAFLRAGAQPEKDYDYKDLLGLAVQYAGAEVKAGKQYKLNDGNS